MRPRVGSTVRLLVPPTFALLVSIGCGSGQSIQYAGGSGFGDDESGGSGTTDAGDTSSGGGLLSSNDSGVSSTQALCNQLNDAGGSCSCSDVQPLGDPPNLYFVLDRSASMADNNKWNTMRAVVTDIMEGLGPRAAFGAAAFPSVSNNNQCASGGQIFPVTLGDSPAGTAGTAVTGMQRATAISPNGGTPTATTLEALIPTLKSLTGKTYVILATDGGPNCGNVESCDTNQCIPNIEGQEGCTPGGTTCCTPDIAGGQNCLDTAASVQAVLDVKAAGFPVYVVGIPGSAPYEDVLDQMAQAGGTARTSEPLYYSAASTDESQILAALKQVAAKIVATCSIELKTQPANPGDVNVYLDGTVLPQSGSNGWSISGNTVTLLGTSCQNVLAGNVLDVRVVVGCPTVVR